MGASLPPRGPARPSQSTGGARASRPRRTGRAGSAGTFGLRPGRRSTGLAGVVLVSARGCGVRGWRRRRREGGGKGEGRGSYLEQGEVGPVPGHEEDGRVGAVPPELKVGNPLCVVPDLVRHAVDTCMWGGTSALRFRLTWAGGRVEGGGGERGRTRRGRDRTTRERTHPQSGNTKSDPPWDAPGAPSFPERRG